MAKRTNKIYNVQVVRYAWIAVEAESENEAMSIAQNSELENYIDDDEFEESEIDVFACETYSNDINDMFLSDDDYVLTKDGAMTAEEYRQELEGEL
jgi:uncharacterized protein (UPF0212 family)